MIRGGEGTRKLQLCAGECGIAISCEHVGAGISECRRGKFSVGVDEC